MHDDEESIIRYPGKIPISHECGISHNKDTGGFRVHVEESLTYYCHRLVFLHTKEGSKHRSIITLGLSPNFLLLCKRPLDESRTVLYFMILFSLVSYLRNTAERLVTYNHSVILKLAMDVFTNKIPFRFSHVTPSLLSVDKFKNPRCHHFSCINDPEHQE